MNCDRCLLSFKKTACGWTDRLSLRPSRFSLLFKKEHLLPDQADVYGVNLLGESMLLLQGQSRSQKSRP
jgi:hypothetical protein